MIKNSENNDLLFKEINKKLDSLIVIKKKDKTTQIIEILTAILLSLATIGSAWCAYQSTLWGGVRTFDLAAANRAGRISSENFIRSNQKKTMDGILVLKYIEASESGNIKLENFYFNRFDSTLKAATLDWLKLNPYQDENAPVSPMSLESYKRPEDQAIFDQLNVSMGKLDSANNANDIAEKYVLLTVLFAGVLFFSGIANSIRSLRIRNLCISLSVIILILTIYFLLIMPVTSV